MKKKEAYSGTGFAHAHAKHRGKSHLIEVTNDIRIHDRSSNFDIYTRKKKIPAYEEMQSRYFHSSDYSPFPSKKICYSKLLASPFKVNSVIFNIHLSLLIKISQGTFKALLAHLHLSFDLFR